MAIGKIHSLKSKTALLLVKKNKFELKQTPCYVPLDAVEGYEKGDTITIPDGFEYVDMVNPETGDPYTTKPDENGEVFNLKMLQY